MELALRCEQRNLPVRTLADFSHSAPREAFPTSYGRPKKGGHVFTAGAGARQAALPALTASNSSWTSLSGSLVARLTATMQRHEKRKAGSSS